MQTPTNDERLSARFDQSEEPVRAKAEGEARSVVLTHGHLFGQNNTGSGHHTHSHSHPQNLLRLLRRCIAQRPLPLLRATDPCARLDCIRSVTDPRTPSSHCAHQLTAAAPSGLHQSRFRSHSIGSCICAPLARPLCLTAASNDQETPSSSSGHRLRHLRDNREIASAGRPPS
jgi:hypothetical protein